MCFAPKDHSAEIMRGQEAERQRNVTEGTGKVNAAFSGFGDDYFKQRGEDYRQFYMPEVEKQGKQAGDQMIFSLARGDNLDSSLAARQAAELERAKTDARARIGEGAFEAENQARSDVANNRSELIRMLEGGGNLATVGNTATARARQLTAPPPFNPITDLFANFTGNLANQAQLQGQGYQGMSGVPRQARASNSVRTVQ